MIDRLKKFIPFELKRGISAISIVITLIIIGLLNEVGAIILKGIIKFLEPALPKIWNFISFLLTFKIEINVITIIISVFLLFPIYRLIDRLLLRNIRRSLIFDDDFSINKGWHLNYWGTTNPSKTNRIENGSMIFEAKPEEVNNNQHEYGAFFDIKNGIYNDEKYEIICQIKSERNCSMKFQLWVHDTIGENPQVNVKEPKYPYTPPNEADTIKLNYRANESNALRIHLHALPGDGKIIVERLLIYKV